MAFVDFTVPGLLQLVTRNFCLALVPVVLEIVICSGGTIRCAFKFYPRATVEVQQKKAANNKCKASFGNHYQFSNVSMVLPKLFFR